MKSSRLEKGKKYGRQQNQKCKKSFDTKEK